MEGTVREIKRKHETNLVSKMVIKYLPHANAVIIRAVFRQLCLGVTF